VRSSLFAVAVALAAVAVLAGQEPAQKSKTSDKDNKTVTVTGCVEGGYLRVSEHDAVGTYNDRFRLAGSKHLLKEIAQQQHGHKLEVTGRVIDAAGTEHAGQTTKIGKKTTVYVGASEVPSVPTGDSTSTLQAQSYRATEESCGTN
jgi:hypothetical protein